MTDIQERTNIMENKYEKEYMEPEITVIHMTETDIITTSGDGEDHEGELTPIEGNGFWS